MDSSSSSSSSSSSFICCESREPDPTLPIFILNEINLKFQNWKVYGSTQTYLPNCYLRVEFTQIAFSVQFVKLYNENNLLIAYGNWTSSFGAATIVLYEQNGSGITGSVYWNSGIYVGGCELVCS